MTYGTNVFGPESAGRERRGESRFGRVPMAQIVRQITADTLALTEKDSDSLLILDRAGGIAVTLPAYPSMGTNYTFLVGTTFTSSLTITSGDSDELFFGLVDMIDTDSSGASVGLSPDLSNDRIFTANGTTSGGLVGSIISCEYFAKPYSRGMWLFRGYNRHTGNVSNPFS